MSALAIAANATANRVAWAVPSNEAVLVEFRGRTANAMWAWRMA